MRLSYSVTLLVVLLAGCNALDRPTSGWSSNREDDPVHGPQYVAHLQEPVEEREGVTREIVITCTEQTKELKTTFSVYHDKPDEASFKINISVDLFGRPVRRISGSGRTALDTAPVNADTLVYAGDFNNEVGLYRRDHYDNSAESQLTQLPIALGKV